MAVNFSWLKVYLVPIFIIFIALYAGIFFIYPAVGQIMLVRDGNALLEERRGKLAAKAEILSAVSETQLKNDLAAAEISLPTDKNASGIIFGLESLAASAGAKLTSFSTVVGKLATNSATPLMETAPETEKEFPFGVRYMSVETTVFGDYDKIKVFMDNLMPVNRLLGVDNVKIDATGGKLMLMVFYQPLLKSLGDIATPVEAITPAEQIFLSQTAQYGLATPQLIDLPSGKPNPFQ
jgi:hypothetical protein